MLRMGKNVCIQSIMITRLGRRSIGLIIFIMAGCSFFASPIPSSGIQYLKSLPKGALQKAKPQMVRLAIQLPEAVGIVHPTAEVSWNDKNKGTVTHQATLSFHAVPKSAALLSPPRGGSGEWTYYALTQEGLSGFGKVQALAEELEPFISDNAPPPGSKPHIAMNIKLQKKLKLTNCQREGSVPMRIAILLDPKRGYVVVWDDEVALSELVEPKDRICAPGSE